MQRQKLSGGTLKAGAYDSSALCLELEFQDGQIRQYANVPEEVWRRLRSAPNAGSYFEDRIADEYPALDAGRASVRADAHARLDALFGTPENKTPND